MSFASSYVFFGIIFLGLYWIISFEIAVGVLLIMILAHLVWLSEAKFNKYKKSERDKDK